jgi:arylsulfatase A-like enzyme
MSSESVKGSNGANESTGAKAYVRDVGLVLLALALFVVAEGLFVSASHRDELVATWEVGLVMARACPIAVALLVPVALFIAAAARLAQSRGGSRLLGVITGALAAAFALALESRAFDDTTRRWSLVAVAAAAGVVGARLASKRLPALDPRVHAVAGVAAALVLHVVNATVLVRLYPAFHAALLASSLLAFASLARLFAQSSRASRWGAAGVAIGVLCTCWTPFAARGLSAADNVRLLLLERAPALSVAVRGAARIAPPAPLEAPDAPISTTTSGEVARALDWTNRDIVLVSIDALRSDHVGAYGYGRGTTPNIDALASEGVVFTHAYCPTPHTSYSVTSMMTGKYMRPLLKMDLGDDSETFAGILRRYGYKTAGFYPPAVFFIDEQRFAGFRDRGLDFEYRKVEFAEPALREKQIGAYLDRAKKDAPLFLWVHIFEPHEPYVFHDDHPYGPPGRPTDVDRYDSEIASADALVGRVVSLVREKRKDPVFIVTADHGEEFGDHGGHHHGTTVFEEQVRVPLVVVAKDVAPARVDAPVATVDILPTTLSALGVPRPARVRGRDLGPEIAGKASAKDGGGDGFAFSETDDFAMIARRDERLVCERKVSACTLYDVSADPAEKHDLSRERTKDVAELKAKLRATELEHGKFEGARRALPDALRRGLQGDADAAVDVATLLDDASPEIRRTAAEVSFSLHAPETIPSLRRALEHAEEPDVKRFCALALVRAGEPPPPLAVELLSKNADATWRRRAALAFAERGDARGANDLVDLFVASRSDFEAEKTILAALAKIKAGGAVTALVDALSDVRLRPYVADALGAIGANAMGAKAPLQAAFANERYAVARASEARALVALGAGPELYAPLRRFAGVAEPMLEAAQIAGDAHLLTPEHGALWSSSDVASLDGNVTLSPEKNQRIIVVASASVEHVDATVDGAAVALTKRADGLFLGDFQSGHDASAKARLVVKGASGGSVRGAWIVPLAEDVAAPPPEAWDAGPDLESTP